MVFIEPFNISFFSLTGQGTDLDYCEFEWFALEMNRDHSVVYEIASKYCILDSFVDHDGYSHLNAEFHRIARRDKKAFFSVSDWGIDLDNCDIEWFALEMHRDHSVVYEIASKYCISDSFVDHDDYSVSSNRFLPVVIDIIVI